MEKLYKFILSWNWAGLFCVCISSYALQKLAVNAPFPSSTSPPSVNSSYLWAFFSVLSIVALCNNIIKGYLNYEYSHHHIPPPLAICPAFRADEMRHAPRFGDSIVFITTTSATYKKTGYYKFENATRRFNYIEPRKVK